MFQNKKCFGIFENICQEDWVKDTNEDDLVRVDKEYVLQDYRKEADIVYRTKLRSSGEERSRTFFLNYSRYRSHDALSVTNVYGADLETRTYKCKYIDTRSRLQTSGYYSYCTI